MTTSVDWGDEDEATVPEQAAVSAVAPMSDERLGHLTQVFVDQDPRDWFAKDGLANVIRELLGEAKLQRGRAETAERELAELREQHQPGPSLHAWRRPDGRDVHGDQKWIRESVRVYGGEHVSMETCSYQGEWKAADGA